MVTRRLKAVLEARDNISSALTSVASASRATAEAISSLARAAEGADDDMWALSQVLERLSREDIEVTVKTEGLAQSIDSVGDVAERVIPPLKGLNAVLGRLKANTEQAADEFNQLSGSIQIVAGAESELIGISSALATIIDKVDDSTEEASDSMQEYTASTAAATGSSHMLAGALAGLHVNLGFLGGSLSTIAIALPAIIGLFGALLAPVMALAGGITAVAVGFGALFGAGLLNRMESVKKQNEDIEETSEALAEVMGDIGDVFEDALEPLRDSNLEIFRKTVEGTARVVNVLAQSIDRMSDFFSDLSDDIGTGFWSRFGDVVAATEASLIALEPVLKDVGAWLMEALPNAILFFTEITLELDDTLGDFINTFFSLSKSLIRLGSVVLQLVLPVLSGLMAVVDTFLDIFNTLPDWVEKTTLSLLGLAAAFTLVNHWATATAVTGFTKYIGNLARMAKMNGLAAATNSALMTSLMKVTGANLSTIKSNSALSLSYIGLSAAATTARNAIMSVYAVLGGPLTVALAVITALVSATGSWGEVISFITDLAEIFINTWIIAFDIVGDGVGWLTSRFEILGDVLEFIDDVLGSIFGSLSGTADEFSAEGGFSLGGEDKGGANIPGSPSTVSNFMGRRGQAQQYVDNSQINVNMNGDVVNGDEDGVRRQARQAVEDALKRQRSKDAQQ